MRIGFIGFGEAGQAFQASLAETGMGSFAAFDILFEGEGPDGVTAQAAGKAGVAIAASPAALAAQSDWVFSAVTAASSLDAAERIAPHLHDGQVFFDINSVSPDRKRQSALAVEASGARYLDMAVMAPVHPKGHRTAVLLAGALPEAVERDLQRADFAFEHIGDEVGQATAVKMVRSLFVKGLEALTVEVMMAARQSDCFERVLGSLRATFPGLDWNKFPHYELERATRHGIRRAAEMRESAKTLEELGMSGALASSVAATQQRLGASGFRMGEAELASEVDRLLALKS